MLKPYKLNTTPDKKRKMKKYQKELKRSRSVKADKILKDFVDKHGLKKKLLKELTLLQNRTRGNLFELMGEVSMNSVFRISDFEQQKTFDTPLGKRRIDLFSEKEGLIVEVKSGYARSRAFVRKQIEKDFYIVKNYPKVKKAVWLLFRGATQPLIKCLEKYNIEYLDLEYDLIKSDREVKNPIIISADD